MPGKKKSKKKPYKIINWQEYNTALKQRGSLTIWISKDIEDSWYAQRAVHRKPGRQLEYSDQSIQLMLTLRSLFKLPLRQLEGLCQSLFKLGDIKLKVPEFSRLSRRSAKALAKISLPSSEEATYLIIDSTGLKVYGESEWLQNKYGTQYKRKVWRKLHIGINKDGLILSAVMTNHLTDDRQCVSNLIEQANPELVTEVIADAGYDSKAVHDILASKGIKAIIPPPAGSRVIKENAKTLRDQYCNYVQNKGIHAWYVKNNYRRREKVENTFYRYKTIIGRKLMSRKWENQQAEMHLSCLILNQVTKLGMPQYIIQE